MRNTGWPVALPSELRSFLQVFIYFRQTFQGCQQFCRESFAGAETKFQWTFSRCLLSCWSPFHLHWELQIFALLSTELPHERLGAQIGVEFIILWSFEGRQENFSSALVDLNTVFSTIDSFSCVEEEVVGMKIGSSWSSWINLVAQTVIQLKSRLCGRSSSLQFHCNSFWLLMVWENCEFLFASEWQLVDTLMIVSNTLLSLKRSERLAQSGLKMNLKFIVTFQI